MRRWATKAGKLIVSPLGLLLVGTLLASVLIPRWTAAWQDRQPELQLKTGLVTQIAQTTTKSVRGAIAIANHRPARNVAAARYRALTNQWLVDRAELQTVIETYFPADAECWFEYSDRVTSFLQLPQSIESASGELNGYVGHEQRHCAPLVGIAPYSMDRYTMLKTKVGNIAKLSTKNAGFKKAYGSLGELLLIDRDRIVKTIVSTPAKGFAHGWWIFR